MPYTNLVGDSSFQGCLMCIQIKLGKGGGGRESSALLKFACGSMVEPGIVVFPDSLVSA